MKANQEKSPSPAALLLSCAAVGQALGVSGPPAAHALMAG